MCLSETDNSTKTNSSSNNNAAASRERVVHNYVDRSQEPDPPASSNNNPGASAGLDHNFPMKLHYMLSNMEQDGQAHIISWQPHGRCFMVHDMREFVSSMLPLWFRQSKFASFQRQLNLYGFQRITQGRDKNAYYHEYFLRGRPLLAQKIVRTKVKGKGARKASSPDTEPRFYELPWMEQTPAPHQDATTSAAIDPALVALAAGTPAATANPALLAAAALPAPNATSLGDALSFLSYSQALSTAHLMAAGGGVGYLPPNTAQGETLLLPAMTPQDNTTNSSNSTSMLNSLLASLGGTAPPSAMLAAATTSKYVPIAPAPPRGVDAYKTLERANGQGLTDTTAYSSVLAALKAQHSPDSTQGNAFTSPGPTPY